MHRHRNILVISLLAVIVIAGLSFGLVKAYAQGQELPVLTPAELLAQVAGVPESDLSVSGDFTITNDLLGPLSALNLGGEGLGGLLQGGSGRLWIEGEKARVDIFGRLGNDMSIYFDGKTVTVYDSAENSLTKYTLPADSACGTADSTPHTLPALPDLQTSIAGALEKLAPTAALAVTGQESVAGRPCYVLTLTPNSDKSLFGSLRVAIDGETFVPLQLEVFGRGATEAVFFAGFTKVSYDPIAEDIFTVPAPPGATVEEKELSCPLGSDTAAADGLKNMPDFKNLESLTLAEAEAQAGFDLLAPEPDEASYPFQGAYVIDLPDSGSLLGDHSDSAMPRGGADLSLLGTLTGPVVILIYGQGFDTVALVETPLPAAQATVLQGLLGQIPLLGKATVNGAAGFELSTALVSLLAWPQDELGVIAVGGVPSADLKELAASVR